MKNILLIVDPQIDFISGSLAVPEAEGKMYSLAKYIENKQNAYDHILVTLDSHPDNHCSFSDNGGMWPKHCVIYTKGWDIYPYLSEVLNKMQSVACYHKGDFSDKEEYSIFENEEDGNTLTRQLLEILEEGEVFIDVCGIAGDYCVLETLKGLVGLVGNNYISVLDEFTASIDGGKKLQEYLETNNINNIIDSSLNLQEYVR